MKPQILLSLVVATVLVGSAGWIRFAKTESPIGTLKYVQEESRGLTASELDTLKNTYLSNNASSSTSTAVRLSQTDLIGRQLFSDYVDLSTRGQATPEKLDSLASAYASNITDLAMVDIPKVTEAITVADSPDRLRTYWQQTSSLRTRNQALVSQNISKTGVNNATIESFAEFAKLTEGLFSNAAKELQALPVPVSLKENHIALINNYLLSAKNMSAITKISQDPIQAYSALVSQANASREESTLFSNIQNTLMANGIMVTADDI